jgi:hypothetical protein
MSLCYTQHMIPTVLCLHMVKNPKIQKNESHMTIYKMHDLGGGGAVNNVVYNLPI